MRARHRLRYTGAHAEGRSHALLPAVRRAATGTHRAGGHPGPHPAGDLQSPRSVRDRADGRQARRLHRPAPAGPHGHLNRINQRRLDKPTLLRKSNVLLMGPTGSGKTHIARKLADLLEVTVTVVDATEYTEVSYY